MVTLSTAEETILQADRVPVYTGSNRLYLKKGLQSTNRTIDTPNETIEEQGNELYRGVSIQAPQITVNFEDLAVDMDMEQILAKTYSTLTTGSTINSHTTATSGLHLAANDGNSGVHVFVTGPTDKITGLVISYISGATGVVRCGEGAIISAVTATTATLSNVANNVNFAVGDEVIFQETLAAINISGGTSTITGISGTTITVTGIAPNVLPDANQMYVYKKDNYTVSATKFIASGVPNFSVKGIDVFWTKKNQYTGLTTTSTSVMYIPIVAAGTTSDIDSKNFRNSEIDILMLYNDYDDNLIFSRYIQDAAVTSIGFNYTADGNATQTYDFQTGKSIDYVGYVNRRAMLTTAASTNFDLDADTYAIFKSGESIDAITKNTTLNELSGAKNFLKVVSTTSAGVRKVWAEVTSGTATLNTDQYKLVSATKVITFGETVGSGTRLEFTYLCPAASVADADAYQFDATAFDHTGTPDVVPGKYQPLTINNADFANRLDGVESTTFTLGYTRDFFNAQGILAQRVKPAQIGNVDGSFTTREGFSKTMRVITDGNYSGLTAGLQLDASKAATYTNTDATGIPLRVKLLDPADNATEIKTVEISKIQVTNIANNNSVSDDSTFEVSFIGKQGNIKISR